MNCVFRHGCGTEKGKMKKTLKTMKKYPFSLFAVSILWTLSASAQETAPYRWTLDECMAYAVEHSPAVSIQQATNASYRQDYISAVAGMVPSIGGSVGVTTSFGRSIDPETNTYSDVSNLSNSYSLSAQVPLFAGLSHINTLRAARTMRLAGREELQAAKDAVALKVMQAYYDVLYYSGAVELALQQLATSREELDKSRKLLELGLKSQADVAEIEAQAAANDYLLTGQQNNLQMARLQLEEAMNRSEAEPLEVETEVGIDPAVRERPLGELLDYALAHNPKARSAELSVAYSRRTLAVRRGEYYPSVYLSGGYSTNFFMSLDNRSLYADYGRQFRDNRGYYVAAQLSIPIFNGLGRRTSVNRARNNLRIAESRRAETLLALRNEVAQAWQQMQGFGKEFVSASKKSEAADLAYEAVRAKYERGMVSPIELRTAADNRLQARSERLRARLQYIIWTRMVDYYQGIPLVD